ncbi:hypothetical protein [Alkalibacterium thalassium]|uniref:Uncharacterized protein n=1 Tax=Alkalibacterium thalassium TaxID=426701 RepID=A0A1G9BTE9_9LACT|nr:hypothetical protein [Alkalibacterium thalassium]SDK42265.1 hypothetical protein SAMN04488098_102921 [Alkalibacterium thalassium]
MDLKSFILEVWQLIKDYKKLIVSLAIVFSVLFAGVRLLIQWDFQSVGTETIETEGVPSQFDLFIEQENLGTFTNSYLIEILATQPNIVSSMEQETAITIQDVLDEFSENFDPVYTNEDPINIERNRSTNVMTVSIGLGTSEENQELAEAYYSWLNEPEHPFFNDKDVYLLSEPELNEEQAFINGESQSFSIVSILVMATIGLVFGIVAAIFIAIIKALLHDKILYSFTYGWKSDDIYMRELNQKDDKISYDILSGYADKVVILTEHPLSDELVDALTKMGQHQFSIHSSVTSIPIDERFEECSIIIQRKLTSKDWYASQRKNLKLYPSARTKIIEI